MTANALRSRPFRAAAAAVLSLLLGVGTLGVTAQAQTSDSPPPANGEDVEGVDEGLLPDSLGPDGSSGPPSAAGMGAGEVVYPNLGSQLSALAVASAEGDGPGVGPPAAASGPTLPDGTNYTSSAPLLLTIQLAGNRDGVLEFLADRGVTPSNVVGDYLEVYVPPELLVPLAQQTGVSRVRKMPQPFKHRGLATSQGVGAHGALAWHRGGFKADGVKVGVIDTATTSTAKDGFTGLSVLQGTDLPSTVAGRCYTDVGKPTSDLANCAEPGGDIHGTIVAESLMDVAPDAKLYVANPLSWADLHSTVQWMHGQGVKVIVYSVTWSYHGAADGTSPITPSPLNTVKWAADNGIIWVNAAGNYGRKAWYGAFADSDGDGYHEWAGSGSTADEAQVFELRASDNMAVYLRWDDTWGGATKDLDLEVRYSASRSGAQRVLGSSNDLQSGGTTDYPVEGVILTVQDGGDGFYWFYVKKKSGGSAPSWVQIQVLSRDVGQLDHYTVGGSVASPGDSASPGVLAVGAADWYGAHIRSYSGRGPTPDGRVKPDIVGADCATTRGHVRFCGTSQAAPHVAGLAALVLGRNPTFTPQQVADYLKTNASDRGVAGADNTWGHGFASLPADPVVDSCGQALTGSGNVEGTWDSDCESQVRAGRFARYYSFSLTQQARVTIDLVSSPTSWIDTYLFLRPGKNIRSGTALHVDDDGGSGRNSRIAQTLPAGDYTIEATTFNRTRFGSFTLSVAGIPAQTVVQPEPEVSIAAGAGVTEGGSASFTLSADPVPSAPLTVDVSVSQSGDFGVTVGSRQVTISTSGTGLLAVATIDDGVDEADGSVTVTVGAGQGYTVSSTAGSASVGVADDDDPLPVVSIAPGSGFSLDTDATEGGSASFTLSADPVPSAPLTVDVLVSQSGDFGVTVGSRQVTIATSGTGLLAVATIDDGVDEADGSVTVTVGAGQGYSVSATAGSASVVVADDDDPLPVVSIAAGAGVTEGGSASFTLSADPVPSAPLTVDVLVSQSGDFGVTVGSRQVTIATSGTGSLSVATIDDGVDEADGSVTVTVGAGQGYSVSATAGSASVVVADDDPPPVIDSCVVALSGDGSVDGEWTGSCDSVGRSGRFARFYTFTMDRQASVRIDLTSSVDTYLYLRSGLGRKGGAWLVQNDDGGDGYNSRIVRTLPVGDYTIEATTYGQSRKGSFKLAVTGLPPQSVVRSDPVVSIVGGGGVTEGDNASFTVSASPVPSSPLTVDVTVSQSGDFGVVTGSRQVTVATSGSGSLSVSTSGDSVDEPDGSVTVTVDSGSGYTVSSTAGSASVVVTDDDDPPEPVVSIVGGGGVSEGDDASFTVSASPVPSSPLVVDVTVSQSGDFGVVTGSRQVTVATSGSGSLSVTTSGDSVDEPDGSVTVTVDSGSGYTVSSTAGSATVVVSDDDDPSVCVPVLPSDAVTVTEVRGWRDGHSGAGHVLRWDRVLAALGESTGESAMTVAESRANEGLFMASRWDRVTRTLEALAACNNPPPPPPPPDPVVSITAAGGVVEGDDATFTVSASPVPSAALVVDVTVSQQGDFGVVTGSRQVTISTSGSGTLTVTTSGDSTDESDGSVTVTVDSGQGYRVSQTAGSVSVVVSDDDDPSVCVPVLPSDAVTVAEVRGWRDGHSGAGHVLRWDRVLAALGEDTGESAMTVEESRANEGLFMASRWDRVTRTLEALAACDNPPPVEPEISVTSGGGVTEGDDATFTVSASPVPSAVLVVDVTVTQQGDFGVVTGSRQVTISTSGSGSLTVTTSGDNVDESDGSVTVTVDDGQGYTVSQTAGSATVAIADNDDPPPPPPADPVVSIVGGGGVTEGDDATFTLTASPVPTSPLVVDVTVAQLGDFGVTTGSRQVTISTSGSGTLSVTTSGDSTDEPDGSVTVTVDDGPGYTVSQTAGSASVAVADDDTSGVRLPPSQVLFSAEDASATEGETLRFRVKLSAAANTRVRVYWRTEYSYAGQHSAFPDVDYPSRARGWLAFDPGDTEKWVTIALPDDTRKEPNEVFEIYLSFTEGGATIADRDATMTIIDND